MMFKKYKLVVILGLIGGLLQAGQRPQSVFPSEFDEHERAWRNDLRRDARAAIHPVFKITKWASFAAAGILGAFACKSGVSREDKKALACGAVTLGCLGVSSLIYKEENAVEKAVVDGHVQTRARVTEALIDDMLRKKHNVPEGESTDHEWINYKREKQDSVWRENQVESRKILAKDRVLLPESDEEYKILSSPLLIGDRAQQRLGARSVNAQTFVSSPPQHKILYQFINQDVRDLWESIDHIQSPVALTENHE